MAPNVIAAAAHIAYDMQPPESLHRTKYQIEAKKNQDLDHTELEMLITMNAHIPLPAWASSLTHYVVHLHGERVRGLSNLPDAKVQKEFEIDTFDRPRPQSWACVFCHFRINN